VAAARAVGVGMVTSRKRLHVVEVFTIRLFALGITTIFDQCKPRVTAYEASITSLRLAMTRHAVAVILPAYNEAATVAFVMGHFYASLPGAFLCVIDNASTYDTCRIARE